MFSLSPKLWIISAGFFAIFQMSNYIKEKSGKHDVKHSFSGKSHFFEVKSVSGTIYNVSLKANCDCPYMAVQGIPNGKICSHVLAALNKICNDGGIMSVREEKINECLQLVRPSNRKINILRVGENESKKHWLIKERICKELHAANHPFVTEAIFTTGGRADILVLDLFKVIEIAITEKKESILKKTLKYPDGLTLEVLR